MNLSAMQKRCLAEMGIRVWRLRRDGGHEATAGPGEAAAAGGGGRRAAAAPATEARPAPKLAAGAAANAEAAAALAALGREVAQCRRCPLHEGRTQTVFGVGAAAADWMVVGEAPGAEEDRQGEPFVGRAGKLLNAMLAAIDLRREEVYIANILKCRPPRNRDPRPEERAQCQPYLERQIRLVAPRIVLAMGRVAAQALLQSDTPIGRLRGQRHELPGLGIPAVVTYHPAYLLRAPHEKRKAWQDLLFAVQICKEVKRNP